MLTKNILSPRRQRPHTHEATAGRFRQSIKPQSSVFNTRPKRDDIDLRASTSHIAIIASQKDLLAQLNPFYDELLLPTTDSHIPQRIHTEPTIESRQPISTTALTSNCSRVQFLEAASRQLSQIINPKSYSHKRHRRFLRNREAARRLKTEEEALDEQYVTDTKRVQRSRQRVRQEIGERVASAYPHKVDISKIRRNCFLTDIFTEDQTKVERAYKDIEQPRISGPALKSLILDGRTTFYSLSKKKCMRVEDEFKADREVEKRLKRQKIVTYVDYLSASRPHKSNIVKEYQKHGSRSALLKTKNKILNIWQIGSRGQAELLRCFDELQV